MRITKSGAGGAVLVEWDPPASGGGTVWTYDVLTSPNPNDFVSAASCLLCADPAAPSCTDSTIPGPGGTTSYLVRARNACPSGEGSLGTDSNGNPRAGRSCP